MHDVEAVVEKEVGPVLAFFAGQHRLGEMGITTQPAKSPRQMEARILIGWILDPICELLGDLNELFGIVLLLLGVGVGDGVGKSMDEKNSPPIGASLELEVLVLALGLRVVNVGLDCLASTCTA